MCDFLVHAMVTASYLSPKCQIRPSRLGGSGVLVSAPIGPDEVVAIWGGRFYTADEIRGIAAAHPNLLLHPLTIVDGFYLGPADPANAPDPSEFFNHGCEPNAGVRGQVVLVARRDIAAGEEVCFDYETTECEASVGMGFVCRCGSRHCRGTIAGSMWRDRAFHLRHQGYISWYLVEKFHAERRPVIS